MSYREVRIYNELFNRTGPPDTLLINPITSSIDLIFQLFALLILTVMAFFLSYLDATYNSITFFVDATYESIMFFVHSFSLLVRTYAPNGQGYDAVAGKMKFLIVLALFVVLLHGMFQYYRWLSWELTRWLELRQINQDRE